MKQTAVEWLIDHWKKLQSEGEKMSWSQIIQITELSKEMEKQQIIDAHISGYDSSGNSAKDYYNETFNPAP
jgi:hypothetical protein